MKDKDAPNDSLWKLPIDNDISYRLQWEDIFCKNILNQIEKSNIIPMKPLWYQELLLHRYSKWLMQSWDIMELIELTHYLRDSIIGKD